MKWKLTVNANWIRARTTGSKADMLDSRARYCARRAVMASGLLLGLTARVAARGRAFGNAAGAGAAALRGFHRLALHHLRLHLGGRHHFLHLDVEDHDLALEIGPR